MKASIGCWKAASLAGLVALTAAKASAWDRFEPVGYFAGNGHMGLRLVDYGIYSARYGVGVGTRLADVRLDAWDIPRQGRPDASAHGIVVIAPLEVRVALRSWEGKPYIEGTSAESSIGRIELHGWYCPWARFGLMSEVQTDILGIERRAFLNDSVSAEVWDYGLRYDAGRLWYVGVGRFEFRTRNSGPFRSRRDGRWYGVASLYFGRTHGKTVGGTPWNLLRDAGFKVCRAFGRCGIIED